jgi:hypothetical protein
LWAFFVPLRPKENFTMFRDPLIQKAWEIRQQAEQFPLEVLRKAAAWLEEKYRQTPSKEIAVALALHYLLLSMRRPHTSPTAAKDYFSQALRWREKAGRAVSTRRPLPPLFSLN